MDKLYVVEHDVNKIYEFVIGEKVLCKVFEKFPRDISYLNQRVSYPQKPHHELTLTKDNVKLISSLKHSDSFSFEVDGILVELLDFFEVAEKGTGVIPIEELEQLIKSKM